MALLLNDAELGASMSRFFDLMNEGGGQVSAYIDDPIGFLTQDVGLSFAPDNAVFGQRLRALSAGEIASANAFLYRLLSNSEFTQWARDYETQLLDEVQALDNSGVDADALRVKVFEDFARAMIDHGEIMLLMDMARGPNSATSIQAVRDNPNFEIQSWDDWVVDDVVLFTQGVVAVQIAAVFLIAAFQIDFSVPASESRTRAASITPNEMRNLSQQLSDALQARAKELYG